MATQETGNDSSIVSVLLMIVGILLLTAAIRIFRSEDDPDASPRWIGLIDSISVPKIFSLGVVLTLIAAKFWVFTLSAIGIIRESALGMSESITTFLIYVIGAESLMILPLLIYAVAPRRSTALLSSTTTWLKKYNRPITIAVSLIFGSLFLWKGISGLLL